MPNVVKAVYVEQYDGWWRYSLAQWRKLLEGGIEGNGHVLENPMLRNRPRFIYIDGNPGEVGRSYYTLRNDVIIYSPLDWETDDYRSALKDLDEMEEMK